VGDIKIWMTLNIYLRFEHVMEEHLDKTFFIKQDLLSADSNTRYWRSKSAARRIQAAYMLSLRAYGYDPDDPPAMDKELCSKRKRNTDKGDR
jgi:hypothetical protein